jgi:hypothetical protein
MKVMQQLHTALIDFFILNLFITLVSLPILVAWGLPLSWLSPIGNLIFSPFLSLFLLTSTLSFFCELLGISHGVLDRLLEYIAYAWQYILNLAPHNSSIGCTQTAFYLLLIISIATFVLLMLPPLRSAQKRLTALTVLFFCSLILLKAAQPAHLHDTLPCISKKVEIVRTGNQTALIDHGAFSERANPASWVQYHFIPDLIKATGSLSIEHLILPRPTIRVLEAAIALMQHASVTAIYYPTIEGELTGSHRGVFRKWYAIAKSLGVQLVRLQYKTTLTLGDKKLTLAPDTQIQYREVTFKMLKIIL